MSNSHPHSAACLARAPSPGNRHPRACFCSLFTMHSCSASRAFSRSAFSWFSFTFSATRSLNCKRRARARGRRGRASEAVDRGRCGAGARGCACRRGSASLAGACCDAQETTCRCRKDKGAARLLLELADAVLVLHLERALELHLLRERRRAPRLSPAREVGARCAREYVGWSRAFSRVSAEMVRCKLLVRNSSSCARSRLCVSASAEPSLEKLEERSGKLLVEGPPSPARPRRRCAASPASAPSFAS